MTSSWTRPVVFLVCGTRPEVIKLAPVVNALRRGSLRSYVYITGQHGELAHQALRGFSLVPDQVAATWSTTGERFCGGIDFQHLLDGAITRVRPQMMLVVGDTKS